MEKKKIFEKTWSLFKHCIINNAPNIQIKIKRRKKK